METIKRFDGNGPNSEVAEAYFLLGLMHCHGAIYEDAIKLFSSSVGLQPSDHCGLLGKARALTELGDCHLQLGQSEEAVSVLERGVALLKSISPDEFEVSAPVRGRLFLKLGDANAAEERWLPAAKAYGASIRCFRLAFGNTSIELAEALCRRGQLSIDRQNYRSAVPPLDKSVDCWGRIYPGGWEGAPAEHRAMMASTLQYRAQALLSSGRTSESEADARRVLKLVEHETGAVTELCGHAHFILGCIEAGKLRRREAKLHFAQSIAIEEAQPEPSSRALIIRLHEYSDVLSENKDFPQAITAMKKAVEIAAASFGRGSDKHLEMIEELVALYTNQDNFEGAVRLARERLPLVAGNSGHKSEEYSEALSELARLLIAVDRFDEAEEIASEALGVAESLNGTGYIAKIDALEQLARVASQREDYQAGLDLHLRRLELARTAPEPDLVQVCSVKMDRAEILIEAERFPEAEEGIQDVLETIGRLKLEFPEHTEQEIRCYLMLGDLAAKGDDFDKAEEYYLRAKKIAVESERDQTWTMAELLEELGDFYYEHLDSRPGEEYENKALEALLAASGLFDKLDEEDCPGKAVRYSTIAELFERRGDGERASEYTNKSEVVNALLSL